MNYLTNNQIDYVLYHLAFQIDKKTYRWLVSNCIFVRHQEELPQIQGKIIFKLSPFKYKKDQVLRLNGIPILYPLGNWERFFNYDGENLIFEHDILKSAFYLLSGYQETESSRRDILGRYPYSESIQHQLDFIHKPVVNYYFEMILDGMKYFSDRNETPFQRVNVFDQWKIMLTHDVDKIKTFSFYELVYRIKQAIGLSPSSHSKAFQIRMMFCYLLGFFTQKWNNPHWDFERIRAVERKFGYRSVYYFLRNERLHSDSYYEFDDPAIKSLMYKLNEEGCEIGLHGTFDSALSYSSMNQSLLKLRQNAPEQVLGIRQHMLHYEHPKTMLIQEKSGLLYDTTLGFAAHEGFRNSYCLPFKLYNFEKDRMIDVWEIPLIAMDATLFNYRNLGVDEALEKMEILVKEVKHFKGIFTLLWHNGFGYDHPVSEVRDFYESILGMFARHRASSVLGREVVGMLGGI